MRLRATKALVVVTSRGPRAASTRNPACVASGELKDAMQRRVKMGERRLRKAVRSVCAVFAAASVAHAAGAAVVPSATSVVAGAGAACGSPARRRWKASTRTSTGCSPIQPVGWRGATSALVPRSDPLKHRSPEGCLTGLGEYSATTRPSRGNPRQVGDGCERDIPFCWSQAPCGCLFTGETTTAPQRHRLVVAKSGSFAHIL